MATSEPLVPKGLPKGSRQTTRAAMQRGGIPLAPPQGGQARPATSGRAASRGARPAPVAGLDLSQHTPDEFPFLESPAAAAPTPSPNTPNSITSALAGSAQSQFAQAVLQLLATRGR